MKRLVIDWVGVHQHYATTRSAETTAAAFNININTLKARIRREGWADHVSRLDRASKSLDAAITALSAANRVHELALREFREAAAEHQTKGK